MSTTHDKSKHTTRPWQSLTQWQSRQNDGVPLPVGDDSEFASGPPIALGAARTQAPRRDFFKLMGLSASAAMLACKRAPKQTILTYTRRPDEVIPGVALHYASTCGACAARCGILVKTRDGRPIKVEGNPSDPRTGGALCVRGQSQVLGLYDADRARGPLIAGKPATWKDIDAAVAQALEKGAGGGKAARVVVPYGLGPSEEAALSRLEQRFAQLKIVRFDPMGVRAATESALRAIYGSTLTLDPRLDEADVVVSFEADFLGTFWAPAVLTRRWSKRRDPESGSMLFHAQIEGALSLTGGMADERHRVPPSQQRAALAALVAVLAKGSQADSSVVALTETVLAQLGRLAVPAAFPLALAERLRAAGSRGLVLCGLEDPVAQLLTALANAWLGNSAKALPLYPAAVARRELSLSALIEELQRGEVGPLLVLGCNPVLVDPRLGMLIAQLPFSLSTADRLDETARHCKLLAPAGHTFEAWTDLQPQPGVFMVGQPTVSALFDTRSTLSSALVWAQVRAEGGAHMDDHGFVREQFRKQVFSKSGWPDFESCWEKAVQEGVFQLQSESPRFALAPSAAADCTSLIARVPPAEPPSLELSLVPSLALDGGEQANNGWLQELPDPLTKVAWTNVLIVSPAWARTAGVSDAEIVAVKVAGHALEVPALVQPGLADTVVALALGHGRAHAGEIAAGKGVDAWPLAQPTAWGLRRHGLAVAVSKVGKRAPLPQSQIHASMEGRDLVRSSNLVQLRRRPGAPEQHEVAHGESDHAVAAGGGHHGHGLWPVHNYPGHRWAMSVDLSRCTGCSACVVSCQAENNIPVVGATEVGLRRDMAWLRIDRYYAGSPEAPTVLHQPMMCQHCENAPCETVCPVLATVHSEEGLNQQIYNRCVGTRYCANNCPTKVRRFNWFDYPHDEPLARMVLNPDVVVRSRGVMEKCSFCVQRIEDARTLSRREGRPLADGDVQTACQQSCRAGAIVFGNLNDKESLVAKEAAKTRAYRILTELNIGPSVHYLGRVINKESNG